ncbi:hypothetical protein [Actinomycetospora atypica]|uniref:Uncharacterized protein n=1 Tax=Actinomycetospora atypica TaxID=1290095 RepID=A0ABV9YIH4_9PSEU
MTAFSVPGEGPDGAEARYAELAGIAGAEVAPPTDRVRSVRFAHGAEEWTATVGQALSGQLAARTDRRPGRRGPASAPGRRVADTATVQAIFDTGEAYVVVTNGPPVGEVDDSTWDNPFSIRRPTVRHVDRFDG